MTFAVTQGMATAPVPRFRRFLLAALLLPFCSQQLAGTARGEEPARIEFQREWGTRGAEPGQFDFPIAIAINADDELFVTDHLNSRVQKFDRQGKLLGHFSVLPNPGGIALDRSGRIYLTHIHASGQSSDNSGDFVSIYTAEFKLLRRWGKSGTGEGEFDCPGGIAVAKNGQVYVADQTNHRVQVFDSSGTIVTQWGRYGSQPGEFGGRASVKSRVGGPQFLAIDGEGNIWTTEGANCRVQKFSAEGKTLAFWGSPADEPGGFGGEFEGFGKGQAGSLVGPIALCFDRQGHLWISTVSGRVQQFSTDGKYLRGMGETQGTGQGQFFAPHGVAIDSQGSLYVVDAYNHRIQKFQVP